MARQKVNLFTCEFWSHSHRLSQRLVVELKARYAREQTLMLSIIHSQGMKVVRDHLGDPQSGRAAPTSWLGQQRKNVRELQNRRRGVDI